MLPFFVCIYLQILCLLIFVLRLNIIDVPPSQGPVVLHPSIFYLYGGDTHFLCFRMTVWLLFQFEGIPEARLVRTVYWQPFLPWRFAQSSRSPSVRRRLPRSLRVARGVPGTGGDAFLSPLSTFSLSSTLDSLIMTCLGVVFFWFILFGVF